VSRTDEDLKKDLFISIEIKYRELNSQLFLDGFAISKGFRFYIGTHSAIERLLEARQGHGGIYFDKGGLNWDFCRSS
jgi:hypothetical protein